MRFVVRNLVFLAVTAVLSIPALAAYPDKPVRLIVPWPAGGSADALGRLIAQGLSQALEQTVVPENVAGASGAIGSQRVARADPNGYTLVLATSSTNSAAPYLLKELGFDPVKDFTPIGVVAIVPSVLIVANASPFRSAEDIIDAARKKPGALTFGSGGNGNSGHLSGELFLSQGKISATHVPYKGNNPALVDLMGGRLDYMFDNGAIGHIQSGRIRALAIAGPRRLEAIPDVPTFSELGMPDMQLTTWFGLAGPAGMDSAVTEKLNVALTRVLQDPHVKQKLREMGAQVDITTPKAFAEFWNSELVRYGNLIKASGLKRE